MTFQIPENLNTFSINGIQGLIETAKAEYDALKATATPDTVSDEDLERLKALREFTLVDAPAEIANRERRQAEFAALDAPATQPDGEPADEDADDDATGDQEPAPVVASTKVKVKDIAKDVKVPEVKETVLPRYSSLVASAGLANYDAGTPFKDLLEVAQAFEDRTASFTSMAKSGMGSGDGPQQYAVAKLVRDYPDEYSVNGDETDYAKLLRVADESRLPGGSLVAADKLRRAEIEAETPGKGLVAAAGWCAPSETDYSICLQITTDGLLDAPEVQARRGGIRHNTGIDFSTLFGAGTGYFNLTEAQVASGTVKTCLEIPCPTFIDSRLGVTGLCLTGNILSIRGYPEYTAAFTRGALAASAHQINREQIIAMIADSTSVNLTGTQPWTSDGSVVSQVLSAVEMAAVDLKYRLRLQQSSTLEVVMPYWILAQMRADWIRRNGGNYAEMLCLADSAISSAFACRGARVQYVYDWQDAFSNGAASGAGAATAITGLNTSLQFLMYPAGTWIRAVSDVITLNSVYDSTKLATNQVTQLFTETGWAMIRMCPVSRVYTVPICANGSTGVQRAVTC